jgi:hypothetical protein
LQYMKYILATWIHTVPEGSVVTLIQFSDDADIICQNENNENNIVVNERTRGVLISSINKLQVMGNTNIQAGIQTALNAQRDDKSCLPHRIVFLSDGVANVGETNVSYLASMMGGFRSKIDVVMLSENSSAPFTAEVKKLQDNTTAHFAANGDQLQTVFSNVFKSFNRHSLVVRVDGKTKIVPDHVQMSEIDLIFDVDCYSNPIISISVKIGDTEENIYEGSFSDIRTDIQPEQLVQMLSIADALKKIGQVKTEMIEQKDKTNFKNANEVLDDISKIIKKVKLDDDDVINTAPIYRSLCQEHDEISGIANLYNKKDPGECPVTFETVEVEVHGTSAYRSLGSCTATEQVFSCGEDEQMYKKWVQDKEEFNLKRRFTQHQFEALKQTCM